MKGTQLDHDEDHQISMLASTELLHLSYEALRALEKLELNILADDQFAHLISWWDLRQDFLALIEVLISGPKALSDAELLSKLGRNLRSLHEGRTSERTLVIANQPRLIVSESVQIGSFSFLPTAMLPDLSERRSRGYVHVSERLADTVVMFEVAGSEPLKPIATTFARQRAKEVENVLLFFAAAASGLGGVDLDEASDFAEVTTGITDLPGAYLRREIVAEIGEPGRSTFRLTNDGLRALMSVGLEALLPYFHTSLSRIDREVRSIFLAIQWHARAIEIENVAASIPLFVISLETLFPTVAQSKAKRLAQGLTNLGVKVEGVADMSAHVIDLYRVRNCIIHTGSHSEEAFWCREAWLLAREAILKKARLLGPRRD